jgi:hypothetical protein
MKAIFVMLAAACALCGLAACESTQQYDGVSRFADTGGVWTSYYGPGSPPREKF